MSIYIYACRVQNGTLLVESIQILYNFNEVEVDKHCFIYLFIYLFILAALGLSYGTWDLHCSMQDL